MEFANKTAILTGAASGMGLLSAQKPAESGASVVLCDVNAERVEAAAEGIRKNGGKACGVKLDSAFMPNRRPPLSSRFKPMAGQIS